MPFCKHCGRSILWLKLPDGRNMPLDHSKAWFFRIRESGQDEQGRTVNRGEKVEDPTLYVSHLFVCPAKKAQGSAAGRPRRSAGQPARKEEERVQSRQPEPEPAADRDDGERPDDFV